MTSPEKENDFKKETANVDEENYEPDVYFEPVVKLPLVERITLEEDEDLMINLKAKLFRFDSTETPSVWKERGIGEIKMLYHPKNNTVRIVMRREKTLKICANHFITPSMQLQRPNTNRRNWWMWSTGSDFADEVSKAEIFAIKFANEPNADLWREKFTEGQNKIQNENHSGQKVQNADSVDSSESGTSEDESTSDSESQETKSEDASSESITTNSQGLSESVSKLSIAK